VEKDRTHGQNSEQRWLGAEIADLLLGVALKEMAMRIGASVGAV
jgi:hypothetical protein